MTPTMWTLSGFADEISPDLDVQVSTLQSLGMRYLEFRGAWDTNVLDLTDEQLDRVAGTLSAARLKVSSIGSPIGKIKITEDFEAHLDRFGRAMDVADRLGAPYIRLFSFFIPQDEEPARYRDEVLRRMAALADAARGRGVVLLHENEKHIYGDTPERCLELIEHVGSPLLRATWDPANFVQCGVRPFTDGYAALRPYVDYIQIKDAIAETGKVVPAGEGDGEVRETLAALRADGFDGFFSLEPHLASAGAMAGFSGPELFGTAVRALTGLLAEQGIDWQ